MNPLPSPVTVYAFHSQVTHTATGLMQEIVQITSVDLNNTRQAIQNNNLTQAIAYLHNAQEQLNKLNNVTLLNNVSTLLLQSGIAYNLNPLSIQSPQTMSNLIGPSLSSLSQSVPNPQVPQSFGVIEETDDLYKPNPILPNLNSQIITPSSSLPVPPATTPVIPSTELSPSTTLPPLQSNNNLPEGLPPISSTPSTGYSPPSSISSEIEPPSPTSVPSTTPTTPGLPPISSSR